ncbi:MAG: heparinase II/III family protein [Proteobacteria bacterium]|nr:heparinase II/III family protein [Pseudomonadota bacterium]
MSQTPRGKAAWSSFQRRLYGTVFATPLYGVTLLRRSPAQLANVPPDSWPGDASRGAAILGGVFTLAGTRLRPEVSPWDETDAAPAWREALHEFLWLRDLRALGGDDARRCARDLTEEWLERHDSCSGPAWRADVVGRRLTAWASHYKLFFASAPDEFRLQLLASMARQARHLGRVAARETSGMRRLAAIKGLLLAGMGLPGEMPLFVRAVRLLEDELALQIAADGSHVERSPSGQLVLLRDLVDMRAALSTARQEPLALLGDVIGHAAAMLRFFRHGDGGLAVFNSGGEGDPTTVDIVLAQADARERPAQSAPQSGFERLSAGKLLAIVDAGQPAPPGLDREAHAGTLSFEASYGRERLIVNCGASLASGPDWRQAARATAAHSTLAIEDMNSSEIRANGSLGRRPEHVTVEREQTDGNVWLSMSHDGYAEPFGLIHRRRIYMAASGDELRGEDSLVPAQRKLAEGTAGEPDNRAFAIRFHIHPAARASLAQDGNAVFLRLPSGIGWRLRVGGAKIDLAESMYFGGNEARRTQQIVLSGRTGAATTTVKWALRREGGQK